MPNLKPSQIVILASGAVLFLFSFLDFVGDDNGWSDFGLTTFPALFGLIAAGAVAAAAFGNVKLPEPILTFSFNQILLVLGLTAFLILFGLVIAVEGDKGIGLYFSLLGSIGLLAGTAMEQLDPSARPVGSAGPSTPPSPF
jgi:hypothetical protein